MSRGTIARPEKAQRAIGRAIAQAMSERGVSQDAMARQILQPDGRPVSQSHNSRALRGVSALTLPELIRMCEVLDIRPGDLLEQAGF